MVEALQEKMIQKKAEVERSIGITGDFTIERDETFSPVQYILWAVVAVH